MKLHQLSLFCAIVENGTIAAAAKKLNCVPSNITIRLKQLEEQLGAKLFNREKNRLLITPQGRILYRSAKDLLLRAVNIEHLFNRNTAANGVFLVGALEGVLSSHMPSYIVNHRMKYPNIELHIRSDNSLNLERELLEGALDLIITDGPIEHPLLSSTLAFRERLMLIVPPSLPATIDLGFLKTLDLYTFRKSCSYRHLIEYLLSSKKIKPNMILEMESYDVITACVSAGLGFSLVPESILEKCFPTQSKIQAMEIPELERNDLFFVWRKSDDASILVSDFVSGAFC
ncbi:TPA: LysR family transcriptional regulator [Serratia marcescens]